MAISLTCTFMICLSYCVIRVQKGRWLKAKKRKKYELKDERKTTKKAFFGGKILVWRKHWRKWEL